ncbi:chromate transporter [Shimia abyssi]|uniref:Chromate transporter n=2 Tax=Shimia abyssi TaxID=1662395 RepID=A0A2P8F6D3_9RHOB|nr:chromate transporter [Shimia abyssi]
MTRVFGRIGLMSFGGPAAQISLMHRELVDTAKWLTEKQFLGALSFCMLLPGPEAMQLATYCGWKLRGTPGGLLAGLLFVLPGAAIIFALAALYIGFGDVPLVQSAFLGIKAAVVAIIFQALLRLSGKVLTGRLEWIIALLSCASLYSGLLPFPAVIALAALVGLMRPNRSPESPQPTTHTPLSATLKTVLIWGTLWAAPVALLYALDAQFLIDIAVFFSKLAVVTFGGAYAVLAYMVQAVVQDHGWITTGEMMDALGLAETTPGPLILVTQFVATLAGHHQGGITLAIAAGLTALWCTFIPCFLWIFAGAPHVSRILGHPRLTGALHVISAAVTGVIINLSLWFTLSLIFGPLLTNHAIPLPDLTQFQPLTAALVALASALLLGLRLPLLLVLGVCALAGMVAATLL